MEPKFKSVKYLVKNESLGMSAL